MEHTADDELRAAHGQVRLLQLRLQAAEKRLELAHRERDSLKEQLVFYLFFYTKAFLIHGVGFRKPTTRRSRV